MLSRLTKTSKGSMGTIEWVFGIVGTLMASGIIALIKMAIDHEHRTTVLETKVNHADETMDHIIEKVDEILARQRARR